MSENETRPDSSNCQHCSGAGMTTVYHELYQGNMIVETPRGREPGTLAAYCICPLGMWMFGRTRLEDRPRLTQLFDVLRGRTRYRVERPDLPPIDKQKLDEFWARMKRGIPIGQQIPREKTTTPDDVARALRERNKP